MISVLLEVLKHRLAKRGWLNAEVLHELVESDQVEVVHELFHVALRQVVRHLNHVLIALVECLAAFRVLDYQKVRSELECA